MAYKNFRNEQAAVFFATMLDNILNCIGVMIVFNYLTMKV